MEDYKKEFVSPDFVKDHNRILQINIEKKTELGVKIVPKGIIHPYQIHDFENYWQTPAFGGVTDEKLNYIKESSLVNVFQHLNNSTHVRVNDFNHNYDFQNIKYYDEVVIYIGKMAAVWGHFMHETLSRLWYFVDNPDCDYKIAYISESGNDEFLDYIYLLGLSPDRFIRINEPIKFKEVIIPEESSRLTDMYHSKYVETIAKMGENIPPSNQKKIYLSRSLMPNNTKAIGEIDIENVFRENGYAIVSPEILSARGKISLMKGADIVVTAQGSGPYNMLFAKDGAKLVILNTSSTNGLPLVEFFRDIDVYFVDTYQELIPVHYGIGPCFVTLTPCLEKFFNHFNLKYNKEDLLKKFPLNAMEFYKYWLKNYSTKTNIALLHERYPSINVEQIREEIIKTFNNLPTALV